MNIRNNRHGVECFEAQGPKTTLVPVICYSCQNFDPGNDSSYLGPADYPECKVLLFFPTRKGTCKRRKPRETTVTGRTIEEQIPNIQNMPESLADSFQKELEK